MEQGSGVKGWQSRIQYIFAPCEESDSCMVLILNTRGLEHAATAVHSSPGMSVQPDIPIFRFSPASLMGHWLFSMCRGLTSACSFFMGSKGWMSHISSSYTFLPSSLACKDKMEDFCPIQGVWLPHGLCPPSSWNSTSSQNSLVLHPPSSWHQSCFGNKSGVVPPSSWCSTCSQNNSGVHPPSSWHSSCSRNNYWPRSSKKPT